MPGHAPYDECHQYNEETERTATMNFAPETMLTYATFQQEQRIREADAWRRARAARSARRARSRRGRGARRAAAATKGRAVRWLRSLTEWPHPV